MWIVDLRFAEPIRRATDHARTIDNQESRIINESTINDR
jgi:hypothetical protein